MAEDEQRDAYMRFTFASDNNLTRVNAIKGTEIDNLIKHLDSEKVPDVQRLRQRRHYETFELFKALPGQIGNMLSHLEAVRKSYLNGDEVSIILEDDASDQLSPYWPMSLDNLAKLADAEFPKWTAIRLQWNDSDMAFRRVKGVWTDELRAWSKKHWNNRDEIYRNWKSSGSLLPGTHTPPLLHPWNSGWGNVATMFSRRGMEALLRIHHADALDDGSGESTWRCNQLYPCIADLTFWPELADEAGPVLVTTPPYVHYRLAELQTKAIREGAKASNHQNLHQVSNARAVQWALELDDFLRPGGDITSGLWWS